MSRGTGKASGGGRVALKGRALVGVTPDELRAEFKQEEARAIRAKKDIAAAERLEKLKHAIREECAAQNLVLAISEKFAGQIRAGVCARLGVPCEDNWPKAGAIKGAIRDLKGQGKTESVALL